MGGEREREERERGRAIERKSALPAHHLITSIISKGFLLSTAETRMAI